MYFDGFSAVYLALLYSLIDQLDGRCWYITECPFHTPTPGAPFTNMD